VRFVYQRIGDDDFRSAYHRSGLVCDDAGDLRIGLRPNSDACQHEEQRQQIESASRLSHVTFLSKFVSVYVVVYDRFPFGWV
jgi:hypothetical protein